MNESHWKTFKRHFEDIIRENQSYNNIVKSTLISPNNILLNSIHGFPLDLFLNIVIKARFGLQNIHRTEMYWNKTIIYQENQHFIEVDLQNPDIQKDLSSISQFILHIIQSRHIGDKKHCIVLKHIDLLSSHFFEFRILLEKYSHNAFFICTTHRLSKIEDPIKSRFNTFRIPLFTHEEILDIFCKYLKTTLNCNLIKCKTRNIIKSIFYADIESDEKRNLISVNETLLTREFCNFNFPPFYDFMRTYDKNKDSLEAIRNIAYKCCQYNISIMHLAEDFLKILDEEVPFTKQAFAKKSKKVLAQSKNEMRAFVIREASEADYALCKTNKGREPIYIESFLCQILL